MSGTINKGWMVHTRCLPFRKVSICQQSSVAIAEILEFTPPHTLENEIIVRAVQSKAVWILALQSYYCDEKNILITSHKQDELKMFENFAGCFLLETSVLCSLNFTISLPSSWEEKDGLVKFSARPFTKRLWYMWWLQKQGGLRCALQGGLPAMALPKNQERVVLSLAVLLPRWDARMMPVWVWSLVLVS